MICGSLLRGVIATAISLYFTYSSYAALRDHDFRAQHEFWTSITWAVWLLLTAGMISETLCRRERILFALLFTTCLIGLVVSAWNSIPVSMVRRARELSLALWLSACLASLTTFVHSPKADTPNAGGP